MYKHAFRNALLPVVTIIGLHFGLMLGGAVMTETIFGWPGMGRLMYDAILRRDYPVLTGSLLVSSLLVILGNVVIDIFYAFLDPRIRYGER